MTSDFPSVKAKEKIEVAVATDTVVYLPFYVSYYNNDFLNTPFSSLEVVIIGTNNDFRFDRSKKLKGDGFATFAVLLGLADAAICDPSFLVYLSNCDNEALSEELRKFQDLLAPDTKTQICTEAYNKDLFGCLTMSPQGLEIQDVSLFRKFIMKSAQVVGGMVSKISFVAVGSENLIHKVKNKETLGACYLNDHTPSQFGQELIKDTFYYYPSPSTGYFIGDLYFQKYHKLNEKLKKVEVDFGQELHHLCKSVFDKDNNLVLNQQYKDDCISFSCDFISVDYFLNKHNAASNPKIAEVEDITFNCKGEYMFSGIIGNTEPGNINKLSALLYCIDYNLFKIRGYLRKNDTSGLIQFLKTRLKYVPERQDELLDLLIADNLLKGIVKQQINDKASDYSFESLLKYYVDRLNRWNINNGGLYYAETAPNIEHLERVVNIRLRARGMEGQVQYDYPRIVREDLLGPWRVRERKYFQLENEVLRQKGKFFLIFLSPFLLLLYPLAALAKKVFRQKKDNTGICARFESWIVSLETPFWSFLRQPTLLYLFGSLFIVLELVSSLFHLTGFHGITFYEWVPTFSWKFPYPDSESSKYTIEYTMPLGRILFWAFIVFLLTAFFLFRKLMLFKRDSPFFYRND